MLEFPFKKLHIINYIITALIIITAILFIRDILSMNFLKNQHRAVKAGDKKISAKMHQIKNIMSYASIVEKNPFGPPGKFHPMSKGRITNKKQGPLSELILVGTATGPEDLSFAIFENKSKAAPMKQEVFAYNEDVYDYGNLTKIEKEWIELTQRAISHKISLIDITDGHTGDSYSNNSSRLQPRFVKKINDKQFVLNQRKVQEAFNNPEHILSDARLFPIIKDGKQEGFRILEVKPGGIYENLGLRNRDILLKINGLELSSPEAAVQTMSALKGMNTVNLDIIRDGDKMTLSYQVR